ncbi:hypothetical protein F5888DRAFT_1806971 [Russula emetica]|nr:hypothetical protein F5888DRAFT_1806971 [Russula emetica]
MAPCKTKQPLEPSSVAAPVAVGRVNAKGGSRRPSARPVGSSQTRSKATTTQLDAVVSAEEFDLQGIDDDDEISDISGPPNPSPKLEPQRTSPQQADALNRPVKSNVALDLVHFFTGMGRTRGKRSSNGETPPPKICKLCSEIYGTDKSTLPDGVANYIYGPNTGNTNLRRHLRQIHAEEYDGAVLQHKWSYKLSSELGDPSTHDARNKRDPELPSFSPEAFLEHLVRFVVADDQSIRVVECPEFRQMCMVLCKTLVDADIPRHDKMREAVISEWRNSFERLKSDLSVGIVILSFRFVNCLRS